MPRDQYSRAAQVPRWATSRKAHMAVRRLLEGAEASAIAAPDPISAAAYDALVEQIRRLAARTRTCPHPHELVVR
jgi:hypothetical protein